MKNKLLYIISILLIYGGLCYAEPIKVEIKKEKGRYQLYRDGLPYFIKGAAGFKYYDKLKEFGGNSIRVWKTEGVKEILDEAQKLGLTVTLGIYLKSERFGFNYNNRDSVERQFQEVKAQVLEYKDHPALLMWGVGNELDLGAKNMKVWKAINNIAKMIHEIDPNHPTMTTFAGVPKDQFSNFMKQCPEIDLLGINVFKDLPNIPFILKEVGWHKPYIISEWGAQGYWESDSTDWRAFIEQSSTEKVLTCKKNYETLFKRDKGQCLGSYIFIWGSKNEGTHTLFSLFLPSGQPTAMIDLVEYLWTGAWPSNKAPEIFILSLEGKKATDNIHIAPGEIYNVLVTGKDPENKEVIIKWAFFKEAPIPLLPADYIELPFMESMENRLIFKAPEIEGAYRLFVYMFDENYNAATANLPIYVKGVAK